jgi:hypothetical protein
LFDLLYVAILGLLSLLGLVELGHEGDEEQVLKFFFIEDSTITEAMGFSGTKDTVATRG